jgi:hypothetical protein
MTVHFGKEHPQLLTLDGGIYVLEGPILDRGEHYEFEDVILAALREMAHGKGIIAEIAQLMSLIASPETPDKEAFRIWHDNATQNRFSDVESTRVFARLILDIIGTNPDLRND